MLETNQKSVQESIINTDALTACKSETKSANRWSVDEIVALFELPFSDLMHRAQNVHRENFDPNAGAGVYAFYRSRQADVRRIAAIARKRRVINTEVRTMSSLMVAGRM